MKKMIAVLLAGLFLLYLAGIQLVYQYRIDCAKESSLGIIKSGGFSQEERMVFYLSPLEFKALDWTEKGKEFTFRDKSYDVIAVVPEAGKLKVTCYKDDEESRLIEDLSQLLGKLFSAHQRSDKPYEGLMGQLLKEYLGMGKVELNPLVSSSWPFLAKKTAIYLSFIFKTVWHPPAA